MFFTVRFFVSARSTDSPSLTLHLSLSISLCSQTHSSSHSQSRSASSHYRSPSALCSHPDLCSLLSLSLSMTFHGHGGESSSRGGYETEFHNNTEDVPTYSHHTTPVEVAGNMAETVNSMQFADSDMYGPDVALDNDENEMCDEENVLGGSDDDDDEDDADAPVDIQNAPIPPRPEIPFFENIHMGVRPSTTDRHRPSPPSSRTEHRRCSHPHRHCSSAQPPPPPSIKGLKWSLKKQPYGTRPSSVLFKKAFHHRSSPPITTVLTHRAPSLLPSPPPLLLRTTTASSINKGTQVEDYCKLSSCLDSDLSGVPSATSSGNMGISTYEEPLCQNEVSDSFKGVEKSANLDSSNGRVMLIDGTSVIYRAYYKLLGMSCIPSFKCVVFYFSWFLGYMDYPCLVVEPMSTASSPMSWSSPFMWQAFKGVMTSMRFVVVMCLAKWSRSLKAWSITPLSQALLGSVMVLLDELLPNHGSLYLIPIGYDEKWPGVLLDQTNVPLFLDMDIVDEMERWCLVWLKLSDLQRWSAHGWQETTRGGGESQGNPSRESCNGDTFDLAEEGSIKGLLFMHGDIPFYKRIE
ncbi:hypothetical protein TEA_013347 [Camellia sinensis var. sinensis]|uniref:Uncharacterized protein n=1 Tax=Camellia sinensis var. sinensis TaxID=542762 RepID=A0A4S4D1N7_CAMSN|nr:hypothetical protein TEA_013347 [Camellia sinensis var. sinensis]